MSNQLVVGAKQFSGCFSVFFELREHTVFEFGVQFFLAFFFGGVVEEAAEKTFGFVGGIGGKRNSGEVALAGEGDEGPQHGWRRGLGCWTSRVYC